MRAFETGVAAARAVAAGQIDWAIAPTPVLVNMVSNAKVNLIGIYGLPNPDWLIGSTDPQRIRDCAAAVETEISREDWYQLYTAARSSRLP